MDDVPRHRPMAFDKMEILVKEMQDPETGVPVRSQKLFLTIIPSAFMGYDLVEWLMDRFNLEETTNVEAINIGNQLCQYGYFFPVNDLKNLVLKDDSSLYRFQSPYYWPWHSPRVSGVPGAAPTLGPDNVEYAIYLVKRTLRNKQRHGLEDYEQEALVNLKKNLASKWDFISMQAEEQVRLAKERKKGDKIVSDSQERAYWRVARPPPGIFSALDSCPVPVRIRQPRSKKKMIEQVQKEIDLLKASLERTRVKTSIALEALMAYTETFTPYDPWLTPPQPSNPWISDDTLYWQINSPLVEVPSEKRVQRWALSIEELISDPTGLQEFTSFLRKEYSHENIRFWLAVMDLRRSSAKQIPKKLEEIFDEFLKPGAPCEINIDGATAEKVTEGLRTGSRYALDHAADHVYGLLLKKDCYPRFVRSDHFQRLLTEGKNVHQKKAKFFNFGAQVKKKPTSSSSSGGAGAGGALSRRRGSDRSLSGSAHELAVCAARAAEPPPPPHSHSQSNLADCVDSGSSSSDVSTAERRRLPQQSTLDGGLCGAPPPLRRLSAVEPRHLAPLAASPPRAPAPAPVPAPPPGLHNTPTPTISVSSAPDEDAASPDEQPPSVFTSAAATPTDTPQKLAGGGSDDDAGSVRRVPAITTEDAADDELQPAASASAPPPASAPAPTSVQRASSVSPLAAAPAQPAASVPPPAAAVPSPAPVAPPSVTPVPAPATPAPPPVDPAPVHPIEKGKTIQSEVISVTIVRSEEVRPARRSLRRMPSAPSRAASEDAGARGAAPIAEWEDTAVEAPRSPRAPPPAAAPALPPAVAPAPPPPAPPPAPAPCLAPRNDVCPWEDEASCESDAPFVKTYATLGYL